MTFPGVEGVVGPPPYTNIGQQIRQSTAGSYPGSASYTTVIDAMGSNAPTLAKTAEEVTVMEEYAADPHPIEKDNFELPLAEGGTQQFGVDDTDPSYFDDNADPAEHDKPNYTGE